MVGSIRRAQHRALSPTGKVMTIDTFLNGWCMLPGG
jgi:hypothetical protein